MYEFIVNNWRILVLIYVVGFALTFICSMFFLHWVGKAEDEDREAYPEAYPEELASPCVTWALWFIMSILLSVMWMAAPLMFMGMWVLDAINRKHPELMREDSEETEEDKESD